MALNLRDQNKKTIITIIVGIIILLAIAITGTVMFLKDRGTTEATEVGMEQTEPQAGAGSASEEPNQNDGQEQPGQEPSQTDPIATPNQTQETGDRTDNNVAGTNTRRNGTISTNDGTTTATTGRTAGTIVAGTTNNNGTNRQSTDNIQSSTITRTETTVTPEQKISETHEVWWTPTEINAEAVSDQLQAEPDEINVEKNAKTATGSNFVQAGDNITYEITVTNKSKRDLEGVEVKDRIPEQTTYQDQSATDKGTTVEEDGVVKGIIWKVDLKAGESKTVSFVVKVDEKATGTISNVALSNGNPSDPVETAIMEVNKKVTGKDENKDGKYA